MRNALLSVKLLFIGLVASLLVACNPIAIISFSPSEPRVGQEVEFDGAGTLISSMPAGAKAVTYEWNFGDNKTGRGETATHTYTRTGTFRVTLTVTDSAGRSGTTTEVITVREALSSSSTDSEAEDEAEEETVAEDDET
jgi:chitodextrinase